MAPRNRIESLLQGICLRGITQRDVNIVDGRVSRAGLRRLDLGPNGNLRFALGCFLRRRDDLAGYSADFMLI